MNPSRRDFLLAGGLLASWGVLGRHQMASAVDFPLRDITAEDVRKAIDRAKDYLKRQQQRDGTWPNQPNYSDGLTSLCTLALLTAGCDAGDETVQKALACLRKYRPISTYIASLQTMVFCMAEPDKDHDLIRQNALWLEGHQVQEGEEKGMWATKSPNSTDHIDNSMTHFAMLALHEAECIGVSVSERTWRLALNYWQNSQNADGSWGWSHGYEGTGSMTCAGIAAIIIASGVVGKADAQVDGDRVVCCCPQQSSPHIDKATKWLERHFSIFRNPGYEFWHSYYLYSLERMGRLTAQRFIGKHDWYREGAQALVNSQLFSGAWPSDVQFDRREDPNVSTSFSLMFLAKGRRPVLLAHLKHEPHDDWNRHRNALLNLVGYVEKAWHKNLTYQVIDIGPATVEDLREAPVLFINGRESPRLTDEEIKKLRMYVDRGGFLFAQQCCGSGGFDQGFCQLMAKVYPEQELRLLPPEHPAWYAEERIDPQHLRELWGIDVGYRTGVIYCPQDLSCYWELARLGRERNYPQAVQQQIQAARRVGLNVLSYATDRDMKFKNPTQQTTGHDNKLERGKLRVANVIHPGGCDAAPAALRNLMRLFAERSKTASSVEPGSVRLTDEGLFEYHLVFLHDRFRFSLTPTEQQRARTYLERGGMIFADAICSNKAFSESFRREMKEVFPERPLKRVPANDPLFAHTLGGEDISSVSLRTLGRTQTDRPPATMICRMEPHLEGLAIGDRYAVIFSPYDISCSLDGHAASGCEGYVREDALKIAANVLLYSCQ